MSEGIDEVRTLTAGSAVSFLVLDGGEYFFCILPHRDASLLVRALYRVLEGQDQSSFNTPEMKVKIQNLGTSVYIEGDSITGPLEFKMTITSENALLIASNLQNILNQHPSKSDKSQFSWKLGTTSQQE